MIPSSFILKQIQLRLHFKIHRHCQIIQLRLQLQLRLHFEIHRRSSF